MKKNYQRDKNPTSYIWAVHTDVMQDWKYKVALLYQEFKDEKTSLTRRSQLLVELRHALFGPKVANAVASGDAYLLQYANNVVTNLFNKESQCYLDYILSNSERLHEDSDDYWKLKPKGSKQLGDVLREVAIPENIKGLIAKRIRIAYGEQQWEKFSANNAIISATSRVGVIETSNFFSDQRMPNANTTPLSYAFHFAFCTHANAIMAVATDCESQVGPEASIRYNIRSTIQTHNPHATYRLRN